MSQPSKAEARDVSRRIPDAPGTVTFDVERIWVRDCDGREGVLIHELLRDSYKESRVERRTITITTTAWKTVAEPADLPQQEES